jgi:hypothetical protein
MKIIGISGRKQAGKNTVANYINGCVLKDKGMVEEFFIDDDGNLGVKTADSTGEIGYGIFDVTRKDSEFIEYAERHLWPYIKIYHFADLLKEMAINLFDLNAAEVYGNDSQKNMKTNIQWQSMPNNFENKEGRMTNREFLEHFGTNIIRAIKFNAWSEFTIKRILSEQPEIAIVPDVRFPNEVESIQNAGGIVIRLTRDLFKSNAKAECALDQNVYDWSKFDVVVDNAEYSLSQLCLKLNTLKSYWS